MIKVNGITAIASDHGGFQLKEAIKEYLSGVGAEYKDFGAYSDESCDYPDYAEPACRAVLSGECERAILVCGTGIGMSIAANKIDGIRAACCENTYSARFTRLHNDANVLCLGGRVLGEGVALDMVELFLTTGYEGGKHARRVAKVMELEKK